MIFFRQGRTLWQPQNFTNRINIVHYGLACLGFGATRLAVGFSAFGFGLAGDMYISVNYRVLTEVLFKKTLMGSLRIAEFGKVCWCFMGLLLLFFEISTFNHFWPCC
jgi:hypothetical protein